jgi:Protein of unknown function (DUF3224)
MLMHASATFQIRTWDEMPYDPIEGGTKLTRAKVTRSIKGDLEGEGAVEYLMFYRIDGTANFVGLERITGQLGGRAGSFVLEHTGTYKGSISKIALSVVPGSGTGDLRRLSGSGSSSPGHEIDYSLTLDYDFESRA